MAGWSTPALLALIASAAATAQDLPPVAYPTLPSEAASAEGFAPKGWKIEARADGDLDGDARADLALVLRLQDPTNLLHEEMCEKPFDTNPRILAVLLAKPGGGYRLAVEDHALIPRRENSCQVEHFAGLAIEQGALRVDFERMMSAGGWDMGSTTFRWRWRDGALRLIGFDYSNVKRNTGALGRVSVNYLTRRAKISTGNIEDDRETVRWTRLRGRAPTIGEVGDGLTFDPDGLIGQMP